MDKNAKQKAVSAVANMYMLNSSNVPVSSQVFFHFWMLSLDATSIAKNEFNTQ
jgi:hypothetical protein